MFRVRWAEGLTGDALAKQERIVKHMARLCKKDGLVPSGTNEEGWICYQPGEALSKSQRRRPRKPSRCPRCGYAARQAA